MHSHIRRTLLTVVKVLLAAAILLYLVYTGWDAFEKLSAKTIDWPMLVAALFATLIMAGLSYIRWHMLIRARHRGAISRHAATWFARLCFELCIAGRDRRRLLQSDLFGPRTPWTCGPKRLQP